MSKFKNEIKEEILKNRPNLSENSLKTYVSILSSLSKKIDKDNDDINFFKKEKDKIIEFIKLQKQVQTKKTELSALYILTGNDEYQKDMIVLCKEQEDIYKTQTKTDKQKENWKTQEEIKDVYDNLLSQVKLMFASKKLLNTSVVMQFFLVAFLSGVLFPPRRSLDYCLLKIRNINPETDNYYSKGSFHFNKFKTSAKFGEQSLKLPPELNTLVKKWIKLNDNDYLLFSKNNKPLSSPQITRILNLSFGGKVSTDLLRSMFLSNLYKDVPKLEEMQQTADAMGHSISTGLTDYVKK